jgi:hypothetical protein
MTAPAAPYVNFKPYIVNNINNTPTKIFGSEYTCILDSAIWINLSNVPITVYAYVLKDSTQTIFCPGVEIKPLGYTDWIYNATLYLEAGDFLYAYSDYSGKLFNSIVSYRQLNELGES